MENGSKDLEIYDKRLNLPEERKLDVVSESPKSMADVIMVALQKNISATVLDNLMKLAERAEQQNAKRDFFAAMARFKTICPPIPKDKLNAQFKSPANPNRSPYTSIGKLLEITGPPMGECGLSIDHTNPDFSEKGQISLSCRVSHSSGHSEVVTVPMPVSSAPVGKESGQRARTPIQDIKTTITYLRSVTTELALGLSGTEASSYDNDGNSTGTTDDFISPEQLKTLIGKMAETDMTETLFLRSLKVETLSVLPTNQFNFAMGILKARKAKK